MTTLRQIENAFEIIEHAIDDLSFLAESAHEGQAASEFLDKLRNLWHLADDELRAVAETSEDYDNE